MLGQIDPKDVCGEAPTFICRQVLEATGSRWQAEAADVLLAKPFRIALILLLAWIVTGFLGRAIHRFARSLAGQQQPVRVIKRHIKKAPLTDFLPSGVLEAGDPSIRAAARAETLASVLRSISSFAVWTIAGITILGELGINLGPLVAGAGVAGVALGFGAQSLVRDFLAGLFILIEDQYGVGDIIDVGPASGTVEAVSLRSTRLRDVEGTVWHVPNGLIERVGNMSQQWARALLDVAVGYGADVEEAERIIKEAADTVWRDPQWAGQVLEEPEVWGVENLGPEGLAIRLVVKTQPAEQFQILRELRARIKDALEEAGIPLPAQQRTIWVRRDAGSSRESASGDDRDLDNLEDVHLDADEVEAAIVEEGAADPPV